MVLLEGPFLIVARVVWVVWVWFVAYSIVPIVLGALQTNTMLRGFSLDRSADRLAEQLDINPAFGVARALATVVAAYAWIVFTKALTERHVQLTGER